MELPGSLRLFALTKPRIIELLLVTTIPTMLLADRGLPPVRVLLVTLAGGALASPASMRLFHLSTAHLTLLFAPIAVVSLLPWGRW